MAVGMRDLLLRIGGENDDATRALQQTAAELNAFDGLEAEAELKLQDAGFRAELAKDEAALNRIDGRHVQATVGVDAGAARADLAAVGAGLSSIDGRHAEARVDVDGIAKAMAEIELLKRQLASVDGGGRGGRGFWPRGGGGGVGGPLGPFEYAGRHPIISAIVGGGAVLPTIGSSLLQGILGGGAIGAAGVGAGLVGTGGILSVALGGFKSLGEAMTAYTADEKAAGGAAIQRASQQMQAAEAARGAAAQVTAAEEQLAATQRQEQIAQLALNAARQQAIRDLQDMRLAAMSSDEAQQQSRLNLQIARRELERGRAEGIRGLDLRQLELNVELARNSLRETEVAGERVRRDYAQARRGGVEQMPGVVAARRAREDATRGVTAAERNLAEAHHAQAAAARAAGLAEQALAQQTNKYDEALKKLPGSGRQVADLLVSIRRRWRELAAPAREEFFGLLEHGLGRVSDLLPRFAQSAESSMGAARRSFGDFVDQVTRGREFERFMDSMDRTFAQMAGPGSRALSNLTRLFMRIAVAAAPDLIRLLREFRDTTGDWLRSSDNARHFRREVHGVVVQFENWLDLLASLGHLISALFTANDEGARRGGNAVRSMTHQFDEWADWLTTHRSEVNDFFGKMLDLISTLLRVFGNFLGLLEPVAQAMAPITEGLTKLINGLNSIKVGNISALTALLALYLGRRLPGMGGRGVVPGGPGGVVPPIIPGGPGGALRTAGRFGMRAAPVVGPMLALGLAVDKSGLFDAGGPISKTPIGSILGIGDRPWKESVNALKETAEALKAVNRAGRDAKPRQIDRLRDAIKELGSGGARSLDKLKKEYGTFANAGAQMSRRQRAAWINVALQARRNGEITAAELRHLQDAFETGSTRSQRAWERLAKGTGKSAREVRRETGSMARKYIEYLIGMGETNVDVLRAISDNTNKELKKWGVAEVKFQATAHKPKSQGGAGLPGQWRARGGRVEGYSTVDNVFAALRGGERVLRPEDHTPTVDRAMRGQFGIGLDDYLKRTGGLGYARGGMVRVPGDPNLTGGRDLVNPSVVDLASALVKRFKLEIGYAFDPGGGHKSPGHNVTGTAIDVVPGPGGSWPLVSKAVGWSTGRGMTVYYDGSFGSTNLPPHGPGHHAHIELGGVGGVAGLAGLAVVTAAERIARMVIKGPPGPHRELLQEQADKDRRAAQKYLDDKFAELASVGGTYGGPTMTGSGQVEKVFAKVAKAISTSKIATLALGMAGYAESGMRDLPYGHSTSQGALQLLSTTAAGLGVSPHDEAAVAEIFFRRGFYGRGGANALAARGHPAHMVAQLVQGSADSSGSNYAQERGRAMSWMRRYGLARGTDNWLGGWALVGESGPELLRLPAGAKVIGSEVTANLLDGLNNLGNQRERRRGGGEAGRLRVVIEDHRTRVFFDEEEIRAIHRDESRHDDSFRRQRDRMARR